MPYTQRRPKDEGLKIQNKVKQEAKGLARAPALGEVVALLGGRDLSLHSPQRSPTKDDKSRPEAKQQKKAEAMGSNRTWLLLESAPH